MNKKQTSNSSKRVIPSLPQICEEALPYVNAIRSSWIGNKSHCEKKYSSNRDSFIDNESGFCTEWMGEIGFLRYYIFHIDNGYISGVHMLDRIDKKKGFSPDNCRVVPDPKRKNKSNIIQKIISLTAEQKILMLKELLNDVDISDLINKKYLN